MENLKLIQIEEKYFEFVRVLRTHPKNISGFINQNEIKPLDQVNYMLKHKDNYFICLSNDIPVGFVGVVDNDIRIATAPEYKKNGIGRFMLTEIIKKFPNSIAKIKKSNLESIKLFESCGFEIKYLLLEKKC